MKKQIDYNRPIQTVTGERVLFSRDMENGYFAIEFNQPWPNIWFYDVFGNHCLDIGKPSIKN